MRLRLWITLLLLSSVASSPAQSKAPQAFYAGFDKNNYPGDELLPALRKSFSYSGYWLNNPPQATSNSWLGKRSILLRNGFGFLLLFNSRLDAELKKHDPTLLGRSDAAAAAAAAHSEGFPPRAIIFLDLEEGGRLLPEQLAYVAGWSDGLKGSPYRAGVYCSGISVPDGPGHTITTAQDIYAHDKSIVLWVANDVCPPSPGCVLPAKPLSTATSGIANALVWQYAQSPRRREFTGSCVKTYSADGNCYAPGVTRDSANAIDLNVSASPDPSRGASPDPSRGRSPDPSSRR